MVSHPEIKCVEHDCVVTRGYSSTTEIIPLHPSTYYTMFYYCSKPTQTQTQTQKHIKRAKTNESLPKITKKKPKRQNNANNLINKKVNKYSLRLVSFFLPPFKRHQCHHEKVSIYFKLRSPTFPALHEFNKVKK